MAARTLVLGIDPGVSGAFAFYEPALPPSHADAALVFDMPTLKASRGEQALDVDTKKFMDMVRIPQGMGIKLSHAVVESVTSRPRQAGQFRFGVNYGRVLGALEAAEIPIVHVSAQRWKQAVGLRGADKAMSVKLAAALFPQMVPHLYGPRGAGLDGRAESLLIAYYGSKQT